MTMKVVRLPQPETPMVYSARWIPFIKGPCRAGWMTSREIMVGVASGQFISNCPRLTAVCIAVGCLLSRNWLWETHPATASTTRSTQRKPALYIGYLLFLPRVFLRRSLSFMSLISFSTDSSPPEWIRRRRHGHVQLLGDVVHAHCNPTGARGIGSRHRDRRPPLEGGYPLG